MKILKSAGLLVSLALCLAAFAGASSAQATVLCKANLGTCPSAQIYPTGTAITGHLRTGTSAVISNNIATISCRNSSLAGSIASEGGTRDAVSMEHLTLGECTFGPFGACTFSEVNMPWKSEIGGAKGNGSFYVGSGAEGRAPGWTSVCGSLLNCTYTMTGGTTTPTGSVTGGNPAVLKIGTPLERFGGFCPASASIAAEYSLESPGPLFVTT
jgi:hypothetical protein